MTLRRRRFILSPALAAALLCGQLLSFGCGRAGSGGGSGARRLVDPGGTLSDEQRRSIADYLEYVESERGVDTRVVIVDDAGADLVAEGVERYERLAIGAHQEGRGLLLLVDTGARTARVEVGYELEHRVRDAEASSMIREFLAPYFSAGRAADGIEASVERLVELLDPGSREAPGDRPLVGSGGAGATAGLFEDIDRLTPETERRLQSIMVPQASPEACIHLELALMSRGIYYRDVPLYDAAWRRANRPDFPARRLKELAREWRGPFAVEREGDHAIAYHAGEKGRRWGPQFLRRTDQGWIIDASSVARFIVYDYSNRFWYAVDGDYPYLALIQRVYEMQRGSLRQRGPAWVVTAPAGDGS